MTTPSADELQKQLDPTPTLQDVRLVKPLILEGLRSAYPDGLQFHHFVELVMPKCAGETFVGWPPDHRGNTSEVISAHVRWAAAIAEALNDLDHAGLVQPRKKTTFTLQSHVPYTLGGYSGSFTYFPEREVYNDWLLTLRAAKEPARDFLFDPDLYLERAGLLSAHGRVRISIKEAVAAYRQELYLAAATMLGSASEGAWLEFFEAFAAWAARRGAKAPSVDRWHIPEHVQKLLPQYKGVAGFDGITGAADVSDQEVKGIVQHYDYLRDVRNYAAHFDPTERFDLTYPGVGIMLLEAARYFATLYRLTEALRTADRRS